MVVIILVKKTGLAVELNVVKMTSLVVVNVKKTTELVVVVNVV